MKSIFKVLSLVAAFAATSLVAMEPAPHQIAKSKQKSQATAVVTMPANATPNFFTRLPADVTKLIILKLATSKGQKDVGALLHTCKSLYGMFYIPNSQNCIPALGRINYEKLCTEIQHNQNLHPINAQLYLNIPPVSQHAQRWLLECREKIDAEMKRLHYQIAGPLFCALDNDTNQAYFAGSFRSLGQKSICYAPFVVKCGPDQEFDAGFTTKSGNPRLGNSILVLDQSVEGKVTDIRISGSPKKLLIICSHMPNDRFDFSSFENARWNAPRVFRLQTNGAAMQRLVIPAPEEHIDLKTGKFLQGDSLKVYADTFKDNHPKLKSQPKEEKREQCVIS